MRIEHPTKREELWADRLTNLSHTSRDMVATVDGRRLVVRIMGKPGTNASIVKLCKALEKTMVWID